MMSDHSQRTTQIGCDKNVMRNFHADDSQRIHKYDNLIIIINEDKYKIKYKTHVYLVLLSDEMEVYNKYVQIQ